MAKSILFVNTVCYGSHGRIVTDLAAAAESAGFETSFAYGRGPDTPDRIGRPLDGAIHLAATRLFDAHGFASAGATRAFVRRLEADPPDVIHLHNLHGYYLHIEILFEYLRTSGIPIVWTLHDCWAFTGHCSHFVRAFCDRWLDVCHDCPMSREYPVSLLADNSRSNFMRKRFAFTGLPNLRLVLPSRWLAALVCQSFLKDYPIDVVPNGVDLSVFTPPTDVLPQNSVLDSQLGLRLDSRQDLRQGSKQDSRQDLMQGSRDGSRQGSRQDSRQGLKQSSRQGSRPLILAVASPFDQRKGFTDTVSIAKSIPEADFVLVGLTHKQIEGLPKDSNITGLTRTESRDELIDLYRRADALINTTYEDTYPTVNMEAIACGTPVAAYDTGGCGEQLSLDTGMLVRTGDTLGMADALREILSWPRAGTRQSCRAHAEAEFDRSAAMHRYMSLYSSLLENKEWQRITEVR